MENPELTKINNIQNESKLSKSTKNAEKYKKISTDEENQDETQIDSITIEKEDVITSSSDFYSINPISIENQSYYYKRLGNTFSFFGDKNGDPLIIIGPHWPMYLCFCSFVSLGMISFFYYFWKYLQEENLDFVVNVKCGLILKKKLIIVLIVIFVLKNMIIIVLGLGNVLGKEMLMLFMFLLLVFCLFLLILFVLLLMLKVVWKIHKVFFFFFSFFFVWLVLFILILFFKFV